MEAEAARAAALLVSDDASASAGIEFDGQDAPPAPPLSGDEVPATWRLPTQAAAAQGAGGTSGLTPGAAARAVAGYAAAAAGANTLPNAAALSYAAALANAEAEATAPTEATARTEAKELAEPLEMPDPADMPPLTTEQMERLSALHARIAGLQTELAAAMAEAERVLARPAARRPEPQARPELVDRRL